MVVLSVEVDELNTAWVFIDICIYGLKIKELFLYKNYFELECGHYCK